MQGNGMEEMEKLISYIITRETQFKTQQERTRG